jgi:xanthine/CO dehydrogenase XdhC/CoxF family maturation factor
MNSLYAQAASLCAANTPFVWASINIAGRFHAPLRLATKMIILEDSIISTIGGGAMEGE